MRWPFKRRAGSPPAAGADPAPVPGERAPAKAAIPPARPSPAPGRHGGISYSIRKWNCGRIRMWDGDGEIIGGYGCRCPSGADWHAWEQELTQ
jgi:hypothetical protein